MHRGPGGADLRANAPRALLGAMEADGAVFDLGVAGAVVRPWRRGDETSLVLHANNRKIWLNLRDGFPHPYTLADAGKWIELNLGRDPATSFAIVVDGNAVGGIGIERKSDVERRSAEIGFWLGEPYWGRGIMTAAVRAVAEYAFRTFDLVRLFGYVFEWNTGSMRVLEKAGCVREACLRRAAVKDGKIIDVYLYAAVRG